MLGVEDKDSAGVLEDAAVGVKLEHALEDADAGAEVATGDAELVAHELDEAAADDATALALCVTDGDGLCEADALELPLKDGDALADA